MADLSADLTPAQPVLDWQCGDVAPGVYLVAVHLDGQFRFRRKVAILR